MKILKGLEKSGIRFIAVENVEENRIDIYVDGKFDYYVYDLDEFVEFVKAYKVGQNLRGTPYRNI